jgi:glycine betaine/proline transport system ATP-binding protein
VRLDVGGRPANLTVGGQAGAFIAYSSDLDLMSVPANAMVTGNERTPMRAAVMVRQITRKPLVLLGDDGEIVGVVGEHELYRGMLKQTELAESDSLAPVAAS